MKRAWWGWMTGLLFLPCLSWAGSHDYYECTSPDGNAHFSVDRCTKGEKQRRITDDQAPPASHSLGITSGATVRLESSRSHFFAKASINGVPMRVVVDTGASTVAISPSAARRANLDMQRGVPVKSYTANGVASAQAIQLQSVELGGNTVRNITGVVMSQELGPDIDALLGMSFLKNFEINTDGMVMTLRPK